MVKENNGQSSTLETTSKDQTRPYKNQWSEWKTIYYK